MRTIDVERIIDAPVERVFETVADIGNFSQAIDHITEVEFLSDQVVGVGTRFVETREMNGKPASTTLEVTEYVPNSHVRIVSDTHGTVWDTTFRVEGRGEKTVLTMSMTARPHTIAARVTNALFMGAVASAVEEDMDAVKRWCERDPNGV